MRWLKTLSSLLLFCIVSVSYSQTASGLNNDINRWNPKLVKATDVNSAFLFSKEYLLADIVAVNGQVIRGNKLRLNLQDNRLYYMEANEEMEVATPVKLVSFVVQEGNKNVATFENGFPPVGKLGQDNFYQVLATGKVSLLLDTKFLQTTRIQVPVGPVTETTKLENYYGSNGSVTVKITKAEDLAELMADKSTEVMDFIQKEKIKPKKQSDLIKVFNYYNGLVK